MWYSYSNQEIAEITGIIADHINVKLHRLKIKIIEQLKKIHMDLINTWQKIQEEKFDSLIINKEDIMKSIHMDSNTTISQLKTRLGYKRNWIVLFFSGLTYRNKPCQS